ncbi:hypothetical protein [Erysipelothrix anatis]|uniref:hypothetical protein n=1 Tax=Erysipelothrix anatis TaxID=2683713 RepID=UPI0013598F38|nr:hypothetical protein [Erysipelothrix anatis]
MYDRIEINEFGIVVIYYDSDSPRIGPYGIPLEDWYTFTITKYAVKGELDVYLDKETLRLINLTIRYLEEQEGMNGEKIN